MEIDNFNAIEDEENLEIDELIEFDDEESSNYDDDHSLEDDVKLYFDEISEYKLLTAEEEQELAKRIENGDEDARETFINSNLRLVISIAKRFERRGVRLDDLISAGNIGLVTAVDKYDYRVGTKFSTFAEVWIEAAIRRSLVANSGSMKIPEEIFQKINKMKAISSRLEKELGRKASPEEIAVEMQETAEKIEELIDISLNNDALSLETPNFDDGETDIADTIPDVADNTPEFAANKAEMDKYLAEALSTLKPRDREIFEMLYGLNNVQKCKAKEIAEKFNVTESSISQIKKKILRNLLKSESGEKLKAYLKLV